MSFTDKILGIKDHGQKSQNIQGKKACMGKSQQTGQAKTSNTGVSYQTKNIII